MPFENLRPGPRDAGRRRGRLRETSARTRRRLAIEPLEGRLLPAMTFLFADAVAVTGTGSVDVESNSVTNDAAGNVYVTGSLQGTADFDPGSGVFNLSSSGGRDVFIAKYTPAGALVWARDLRGGDSTSVAQGSAVAVDASGNVLVAGTFTGTVNFDPNAGNTSHSAPGRNDVFVARYDPSGNLLWARDVVGTSGAMDQAYAVAVDGVGNVAVAGSFQSAATFGSTTVTAGGSFDSFVAKLDPAGTFLWAAATTGAGSSVAQAAGVAFDGSRNVVATGFFAGTVNFNPGAGAAVTLPTYGSRDAFVQKLTPTGGLSWAEAFGGADIDQGNSVTADAAGNVYVTGLFSDTVDFNPDPGGAANLTAGGFEDGFLLKLGPDGRYAWVNAMAVQNFNIAQGTGVALDGSGHVYVAGYFQGTLRLAGGTALTSAGGFDVFVAEYDTAGAFVGGQGAGGSDFDADFGIGVNSSGQVAIAGRYTGPATFGSFTLPAQTNKSIFIAQLASSTVPPPSAPSPPSLQAASDSGLSTSDRITNRTSLTFDLSGAVAGALVELLRDGAVVASRTGPGALTDPGPVGDGIHVYTARQTDGGLTSAPSGGTAVTVNTATPPTPAAPALNPADDSGTVGDRLTNVKQPRLTGTIEASALVQLLDAGGNVVATATAGSDGSYTIRLPAPLADGTYAYRVREQSVAGNLSAIGATLTLVIDTTPPPAPSTPTLLAADDSGTIGDRLTNVGQPQLTGTATAGATVQLINASGTVLGSAVVAGNGVYTVSPSSPLTDGAYALRTQAVDAAGNVGTASGTLTLTIDTTPPAAPTAPSLLPADDSGTQGDGLTSVRQPHLTGTAVPGATVQILDGGGQVIGSGVAAVDGSYSVAPTTALADGTYSVRARAVDPAGNVGPASAAFSLTVQGSGNPPAVPSVPALFSGDDTGVTGDGMTRTRQPHVVGTGAVGTTVQILNAAGTVLGSAQVGSDGSYLVLITSPLADGSYPLQARAVDALGTESSLSAAGTIRILATPPPTPALPVLLAADDSGTVGDGITNVNQPRLTGSAVGATTAQVLTTAGTLLGSATVAGDGSYTLSLTSPLADGTYALTVRVFDAAGNVSASSPTFSLTIDTQAPAQLGAPALLPADDSGVAGDGVTVVTRPRLTGSAATGLTVQLLNASGTVLGTAVASGGTYTVSPAAALGEGAVALSVRAVDAAGNVGTAGPALLLTIDTVPPAAPTGPTLLPADDSGAAGDGITSVLTPRLTGTGEVGGTAQLLSGGAVIGSALVDASGSYTVRPAAELVAGTYSLRVQVVDAAGNVGPTGPTLTLTIQPDALPAPEPPALTVADDTGPLGDGKTSVRRPRLVGTAEPGAVVELLDPNGIVLASTTAALSTGSYTLQPVTDLSAGALPVRVRVQNAVGAVSPPSAAFPLTVVGAAPGDFTGDGKTDVAVFRPANALWIVSNSAGGPNTFTSFGGWSFLDIGVPGDYDGIGRAEYAVFRPSTGQWFILSPTGARVIQFGAKNYDDIPVPGDYLGLGYTQPAVYRPSTGQWFVLGPNGGMLLGSFGAKNLVDIPIPGDYDGVGHTQMAVYRPSTAQWFVMGETGGRLLGTFGAKNFYDIPIPGDYDGVGRTEMAIFRPSTAQFFVLGPNGGYLRAAFGSLNLFDIPPEAPIASLRKLGVVGGPRIMSAPGGGASSSASHSAALTTAATPAPAPVTPPPPPPAPPVYIAVAPPVPRKRPAQDLVSLAIESIVDDNEQSHF